MDWRRYGLYSLAFCYAGLVIADLRDPSAVSVSFSRTMDRRLDMLLVQIMGACFIAIVAAHIIAGRSAVRAAGGTAADSRLSAGLLGWHLALMPVQLMHAEVQSSSGYRRRLALLIIGAIVAGAHHMRQTSAASVSAGVLQSVSDAARALVVFPITGPEKKKTAAVGKQQTGRSPAASYEAMRVQLLTVASWALAGSGWAYVLLPRPTLDALFGESGDQADVLLWRLIGVTHLLLANITQNLQARPSLLAVMSSRTKHVADAQRRKSGAWTRRFLAVGVTATAFAHVLVLGPPMRVSDADGGSWALPLAAVMWAGVGSAVACQLLLG